MSQELDRIIQQLVDSGKLDPGMLDQIYEVMKDPAKVDFIIAQLKDLGADEIGSGPPLNIEDFYREAPGLFEQHWPLHASIPLPLPFDQLDRKTQFYVLFGEWTRREMEGLFALNRGQTEEAEKIFQECLARAEQIEVAELVARSYEGFMRVAQRRGDLAAERRWLQQALAARAQK